METSPSSSAGPAASPCSRTISRGAIEHGPPLIGANWVKSASDFIYLKKKKPIKIPKIGELMMQNAVRLGQACSKYLLALLPRLLVRARAVCLDCFIKSPKRYQLKSSSSSNSDGRLIPFPRWPLFPLEGESFRAALFAGGIS